MNQMISNLRRKILFVGSKTTLAILVANRIIEPEKFLINHLDSWQEIENAVLKSPPDLFLVEFKSHNNGTIQDFAGFVDRWSTVPIIMLHPVDIEPAIVQEVLRLGVFDCLAFPDQSEKVKAAIQRGLESTKFERDQEKPTVNMLDELQHRIFELETLSKVGKTVTSILDLDEVLSSVVKSAVELTGAEGGSLLLLDETTNELYMRAAYNFQDSFVRTFRLPIQDSLAGQVIQTNEPVILDKKTPEKIKTAYLVHSLIYVPLHVRKRVIGVLGVDNRSKPIQFEHHHITLMSALADYAAIAIENARLYTRTEVERNKLDSILARIGDGVIVLDDRESLVYANRSALLTFNIPDDYEGKPAQDLPAFQEVLATLHRENATNEGAAEIPLKSGLVLLARFAHIPEVGMTITIQDVTQLKNMDRIKSEFVHNVSHDLRSPLTAILGYVELLGRTGELNKQQKEFVRRVQTSVSNITNLINDLLDLGRIEAGIDKQKELVPISAIVKYAVEGLENTIAQKGQFLTISLEEILPAVWGNPTRLRQMFNNLVENASKYTPPGGRIAISAHADETQVIIQVKDNGIGIPLSEQPYIFDKLYRASNIPRDTPGSGLGLSIAKSIIEAHLGRYWFESIPGEGTTFTVVLPAANPPVDKPVISDRF